VDAKDAPEPSFSLSASVSYAEEGISTRMDKMSSELDGLVRFLRRGVESLAGGGSEAAPAFGVLAFALEDWDN
jgi:gamma-tubulin complex component 5